MNVPKLRFKEFDGDWSTNKIEEISIVTSGGTPSRSVGEYWNGDIPWVTTSLVDFNVINEAKEFITQVGLDNSSAKLFPKDTILMAMYGQGITRGKVAILGIEATTNQACAAIKLKKSFDTKFIFQNLMNRYEEIRDLSNEGGQKNLSAGIIKEIFISFPEKEEQTKIASFVSTVDEKINQLSQKLHLLSQYKQGMMQKLFSQQIRFKADDGSEFGEWEETTLGALYNIGSSKRVLQEDWKSKGIPFLRTREIISLIDKTNFSSPIFIAEKLYDELTNKYGAIKENDILVSGVGTVGKAYIVKASDKFYFKDGNVIWLRSKELNNSRFIYYFFQSHIMENYFVSNKSITTVDTFTIDQAKKVKLLNPSIEEQTKIANFLSIIDQKIEVVAQQIEQAKQWKKGLLQQMFL